jgi:hypothetical protein
MITLRSAFPVRMSYNVNVRSEPMLARTDDSLRLKRMAVIVSVEVGKVIFEIGALLQVKMLTTRMSRKNNSSWANFVSSHI